MKSTRRSSKTSFRGLIAAAGLSLFAAGIAMAASSDKVTPGEFIVEPPTLIALGFEWRIEGDANRNAAVTLQYRETGDAGWRQGMPLLRLQNERVKSMSVDVTAPNMFAGSVFDLAPDTEYQVKLTMSDPDGVTGKSRKIVTARTRAEPQPAEGGKVYHVYPPGYQGVKQDPAFTGLLPAYYTGTAHADWSYAFPPRVEPGDVILVHAGLYKDDRFRYGSGMGTVFDGTYFLTQSGTPEKPIVIKAAGDGEVIFDGDDNHVLFNVMAANYNYFEGLTIRNTNVAFLAGQERIAGSSGITLKRNTFENVGIGITTEFSGSKNFYIADNSFTGRHDPQHLMGWVPRPPWVDLPGFPALVTSNFAVKVYGSGHVVAYNRVVGFHDGIDHATYGNPDGNPDTPRDRMPVAIDFYNNDIFNVSDNCIEADGAMYNIRVLRNRCLNQAHRALSTQPVFGGPVYFVRNIVYNAPQGGSVKYTASSSGILTYNNTLIGEVYQMGPASNQHYRNNLILGQGAYDEIFSVDTFTNYSSSDYNGFRPNKDVSKSFGWNSPPFATMADFAAEREVRSYQTLEAYATATGQDRHSVLIDYDVFVNVGMPDPSDVRRLYRAEELNFHLKAGAKAVDAGIDIPGVTDGYSGLAPDLGALEQGHPEPHYGPRP